MTLLTIYKGETTVHRITVTKSDGSLRDITGATIEFTIGPSGPNPTPVHEESTASGGIVILTQSGETLGQADITIAAGDLVGVNDKAAGVYEYAVTMLLGGVRTYVIRPEPGSCIIVDTPNPS